MQVPACFCMPRLNNTKIQLLCSFLLFSGRVVSNPSPQERSNMFLVHMTLVMDGTVKKWQCGLCGKMSKLKADILDHVEAKHMENTFQYYCRYCTKVLNTNGNLRTHEVNSYNSCWHCTGTTHQPTYYVKLSFVINRTWKSRIFFMEVNKGKSKKW